MGRALRLAAVAAYIGWFIALRPTILGGPAGWILVAGDSMEPNVHAGSLVVTMRRSDYHMGDIVAYRVPMGDPGGGENIIHRIVGGSAAAGFVMRGDNTNGPDIWHPRPDDVVGAAWLVIPEAAPAILFLRSPLLLASVATSIATYAVLGLATSPVAVPGPASSTGRGNRRGAWMERTHVHGIRRRAPGPGR
jgi:signal peptidase I